MGRTSLRPWFMGNKMQFEAVACRLFLHYSYTLAQKASNYGLFCFYNKTKILNGIRDILLMAQSDAEYSAFMATIILNDDDFIETKNILIKLGLWSEELDTLHKNAEVLKLDTNK